MEAPDEQQLMAAARLALRPPALELMGELAQFVSQRLRAACAARERLGELVAGGAEAPALQAPLHALVRECWDALDGLGRQVNLWLYDRLPEARLWEPTRMTRQCTLYTVRRALAGHPAAAAHPLARLLREETRERPDPDYVRLSFLHNLALFAPVPLMPGGRLPGSDDLPPHLAELVRRQQVAGCGVSEGAAGMVDWTAGFVRRCWELLTCTGNVRGA